MALSAASYGVKALPGPPPMPGVNVDDGGTRAEGALAAGVVEFEPPAMELQHSIRTRQSVKQAALNFLRETAKRLEVEICA